MGHVCTGLHHSGVQLRAYLQVAVWGGRWIVLSPPTAGLRTRAPAGPVIQVFDGGGGALHGVEVR